LLLQVTVEHRQNRGGPKAIFQFFKAVQIWGYRLGDHPKALVMDEVEMGIVKGVFHQAQAGAFPDLIELMNLAKPGIRHLWDLGNIGQGIRQCHPNIAIALLAAKPLHLVGRGDEVVCKLGHLHTGAGAVKLPAVIGAADVAIANNPFGKLGRAMAATIQDGAGLP
jgi:hypothetical protein